MSAQKPSPATVQYRTGLGYDIHRLVEGRPLVLGGVAIPSAKGLDGHSDADVLLHAVCDALLGAAGLGDIGTHFPNTDPRWKDASSLGLLERVCSLVRDRGFLVVNIDATVVLESPKIGAHTASMKKNIAATAGISPDDVGVKATTNETLGAIGKGEGCAAFATVMLRTSGA